MTAALIAPGTAAPEGSVEARPAPGGGWVLITGAGSAIARAIARGLAAEGRGVILAARDAADAERLAADLRVRGGRAHAIGFDAERFDEHSAFFRRCLGLAGGALEGVVIAQGFMAEQRATELDPVLAARTVAVNFTGAASIAGLAAAHLAARERGFICVLSSVAGDRARQSNFTYGSSKAAINSYLDGLRHRLARTAVRVVTVKPGFVDTGMTWGVLKPGSPLVASPERVARDVVRAIRQGRAVVYTPWFWRWIMLAIRLVPGPVFRRTKL